MRVNDVADLYAALDQDFPRDAEGRSIGLDAVLRDLSDALREAGDESAADCIAWCWRMNREPRPRWLDMPYATRVFYDDKPWSYVWQGMGTGAWPQWCRLPTLLYETGTTMCGHGRRRDAYISLVYAWRLNGCTVDGGIRVLEKFVFYHPIYTPQFRRGGFVHTDPV